MGSLPTIRTRITKNLLKRNQMIRLLYLSIDFMYSMIALITLCVTFITDKHRSEKK